MNFDSHKLNSFPTNYTSNKSFIPWYLEINRCNPVYKAPLGIYHPILQLPAPLLFHQLNYYQNNSNFTENTASSVNKPQKSHVEQKPINKYTQKPYSKPVKSQQIKVRRPIQIIQLSDDSQNNQQQQHKNIQKQKTEDHRQKQTVQDIKMRKMDENYQIIESELQKYSFKDIKKASKRTKRKAKEVDEGNNEVQKGYSMRNKRKIIKRSNLLLLTYYQEKDLQILRYRDFNHKEVMSGPLFQANLPKFIKNTPKCQEMMDHKRQMLMIRIEK